MKKDSIFELENTTSPAHPLEEICREGARHLLAQAIQTEVEAYLAQAIEKDEHGRRMVTRNGHLPKSVPHPINWVRYRSQGNYFLRNIA